MTTPNHNIKEDDVWRVNLRRDGKVDVWYIGLNPIDDNDTKLYDTFSDIPEWMQHRVIALHMLPPSQGVVSVDGVGLRVSETIYWVVE